MTILTFTFTNVLVVISTLKETHLLIVTLSNFLKMENNTKNEKEDKHKKFSCTFCMYSTPIKGSLSK